MKKTKTIIAIIVMCVILFAPKIAIEIANKITTKSAEVFQKKGKEIANTMTFAPYDNKIIPGVNIHAGAGVAYSNHFSIYVKTLKSNDFIKYTNDNHYKISDKNNPNYIDNNAKFKATLKKNFQGKVKGIEFIQENQ